MVVQAGAALTALLLPSVTVRTGVKLSSSARSGNTFSLENTRLKPGLAHTALLGIGLHVGPGPELPFLVDVEVERGEVFLQL